MCAHFLFSTQGWDTHRLAVDYGTETSFVGCGNKDEYSTVCKMQRQFIIFKFFSCTCFVFFLWLFLLPFPNEVSCWLQLIFYLKLFFFFLFFAALKPKSRCVSWGGGEAELCPTALCWHRRCWFSLTFFPPHFYVSQAQKEHIPVSSLCLLSIFNRTYCRLKTPLFLEMHVKLSQDKCSLCD